jgi:hypothetical protein
MLGSYPIPAYARVVAWLRDVIVLDLPSAEKLATRTAIIPDADADMRILDVLFALHAQNRHIRANVVGLTETKGRVTFWYGDPLTIDKSRQHVSNAAYAALFPLDKWQVNEPILAPMRDGVLVRAKLQPTDLLRTVPERFSLGLVQS